MSITQQIVTRLSSTRIHCQDEYGLQDEIEKMLNDMFDNVQREVSCDKGRIDFVVDDVAIELKVDGSSNSVLRQLKRYAELPWVTEIVLITTRAKHRSMPATINGKPLRVSFICAL
jgi:hypothetical protein